MKKILVLALAAVCILGSFTACKGADVSMVEPVLTASAWGNDTDGSGYSFSFQTGRVVAKDFDEDGVFHTEEGNYKLNSDGTIEVYWDDPESNFINILYYNFENDALTIFVDEEKQAPLFEMEK